VPATAAEPSRATPRHAAPGVIAGYTSDRATAVAFMGKITHDRLKDSSLQGNRFARLHRDGAPRSGRIATSQGSHGLARPPGKRDDGHMKRGDDESEFYGAIIRRAKRVRDTEAARFPS
jgi:hypothetical protein